VFGVDSGMFLGFLVSQRGIKVNPDKIKEDIPDQLTSVKEVQRLTERLASLSRFISRSSKKCHHVFLASEKEEQFRVDSRILAGTEGFKKVSIQPPLLSKSGEGK